jgi:hypothetical protein
MSAHTLVIMLVSIVIRTILTRALLDQGPLSAFRRLVNWVVPGRDS